MNAWAFPEILVERRENSNYNGRGMGILKMKWRLRLLPLVAIFLLSAGRISYTEETLRVECFPRVARQGEVCLVRASGPESLESIYGEFQGEKLAMAPAADSGTYQGLVGIDLNTSPGTYEVRAIATDGSQGILTGVFSLRVEKVDFSTQRLTLPRSMVDLDAKTLDRVNREMKRLKALFKTSRDERLWDGAFVRPVEGAITTAFGLRRVINGQPRSPHTGLDLRAPEGTPVRACNSGVAVLVDDLFFSGTSVILDHGWGMYSMYFHLSEALVHQGDEVAKGAILGRAGSTGRATGPHLHWGVKVNGARVDPLSLIRLAGYLEE